MVVIFHVTSLRQISSVLSAVVNENWTCKVINYLFEFSSVMIFRSVHEYTVSISGVNS